MPDFLIPIDYADRHGLGQVPLSLIYLQIDRMLAEGHLTAIDLVICWLRNVALGANVVYFVLDIEGWIDEVRYHDVTLLAKRLDFISSSISEIGD